VTGLTREPVVSPDGTTLATYVLGETPDGRPWADLLEPHTPDLALVAQELLLSRPGWLVSAGEVVGTLLLDAGAQRIRHAHAYTLDLTSALPPALTAAAPPPGSMVRQFGSDPILLADALAPALSSAYRPGHPDYGRDVNDLVRLLAGRGLGAVLPVSRIAFDTDGTALGACLVTSREGSPPHGGPWVADLFRSRGPEWAGLGATLLAYSVRAAAVAGLPGIGLVVSEGNPARRVYERLGFTSVASSLTVQLPMR